MARWFLIGATALAVIVLLLALGLRGPARYGAGYYAKILCSEVFVAGRSLSDVQSRDFNDLSPFFDLFSAKIDEERKSSATSLFGLGASKAVYREGLGCTLLSPRGAISDVKPPSIPSASPAPIPSAAAGTRGAIKRIDYDTLRSIVEKAFETQDGHRALLVLVDGKIVEERYADGFNAESRFLSWSMAKSVVATLTGAAADAEIFSLQSPAPVPEWDDGDKRAAITWEDLLRMQTGLAFEEVYERSNSDVSRMLYWAQDMGASAAQSPLAHAPGDHWEYSSGTSNILSRALHQTLRDHQRDVQTFARQTILDPIGAHSFVLETDPSGVFVGSSYAYATARDWARLGQLYLQNGVWDGERLLSQDWIDLARTQTTASDGNYGAHFWLNFDGDERERWLSGLPEDVYYMAGHDGQYVIVIPSKNCIIVRTGITRHTKPINVIAPLAKAIFDTIGDAPLQ